MALRISSMMAWLAAVAVALAACGPMASSPRDPGPTPAGKGDFTVPEDLDHGLRAVYAFLDSTDGVRKSTWLEELLADKTQREQLKTWASKVFVRHPEFLDSAMKFVGDITAQIEASGMPEDIWPMWQGQRRMWLIWDSLERFGWDVVGVEDDGDDARTVKLSLQWIIDNADGAKQLRAYLDRQFNGLYYVWSSFPEAEAARLLKIDTVCNWQQNGLADVYAYLDPRDGVRTAQWLDEALPDAGLREGLESWAETVFVRHPGFLDSAMTFVDSVTAQIEASGMPEDLWPMWKDKRMWLIWDSLEQYGWDVVGVEDDGDDARTVKLSLQYIIDNREGRKQLRDWLDTNYNGLHHVWRSLPLKEAAALLALDQPASIQQDAACQSLSSPPASR